MSVIFQTETPWVTAPTTASTYEIYAAQDHVIIGNGVDLTVKYDGTNVTTLLGAAPKGDILFVYKERLMIAGDPAFPSRIWYANVGNAEGWNLNTDWQNIRVQDGGKINGISIVNDEVVVSKTNGRKYGWRIFADGDPTRSRVRVIEDDKGSVNKHAATVYGDKEYYLDRNAIFTVPGGEEGGLTYIVQELIDAIPPANLKSASMGSNDGKIYLWVGDISLDYEEGITIENAVLVYDVINDIISVRDQISARVFTRFTDATNTENLYFGDENGKVYQLDSGTTAGTQPITFRVRTKAHFEDLGELVTIEKVKVFLDDPDGTVVTYRLDKTQPFRRTLGTVTTQPWQEFKLGSDDRPVTGASFQLEFIHSNRYARPTVNGYEITYSLQNAR